MSDNVDYLCKNILNDGTLEKAIHGAHHRKSPEKIVAQKFDYDCGWGMVCTALLMLNREELLKTDIYKRLSVNPVDGTRTQDIKNFFEEESIPCIEIRNSNLTLVEDIINDNGLVMISYQSDGTEEELLKLECGHYSIIFDIDAEFVWLIDPSLDAEYTPGYGKGVVCVSREDFDKRWVDKDNTGGVYDHWMLAVRILNQ